MNKTILIYNDASSKTCSAELSRSLANSFSHESLGIVATDRHSLAKNIKELDPSVIIIPEIKGEESFYSHHINQEARRVIRDHIENGAMLAAFCAGAYWMCEKIVYNPPHGPTKIRSGQHVFNAVSMKAYGPLPGYGRPSNDQENLGGCINVPIQVSTIDGKKNETVWYGNGPAFLPANNELPTNIDIIARYKNIEDCPIAACSLPFGKGQILLSGPLPHYMYAPVKKNNFLWRVITHRIHQQLFAKQVPSMVSVPA